LTIEPAAEPDASSLLEADGPVARAFAARNPHGSAYEARPQQLEMARRVGAAMSSGRHALLEAGTGVGKTFAYLVPALEWAARTGGKIAVATSTIALQEQLVRKDLPLLVEALPFEVSFALVKGRGNYLCLRRMERALQAGGSLFDDEPQAQLEAIVQWAQETSDGSRQDLPFQPLPPVWEQVQAEQGNCMGRACRHYEHCHYQRSRRRAHAVDLLVLNHHVLMADLALRRSGGSFLPKVDALIIDEAHDLLDTAAEHLGKRVSSRGVRQQLGRLWSPRRRGGLLAGSAARAEVESVRHAADVFFGEVDAYLHSAAALERGRRDGGGATTMLPDGVHLQDDLSPRLAQLSASLIRAATGTADKEIGMEIGARARGLRAMADGISALARDDAEGQVRWGEVSPRGVVTLRSAPVEVGPLLKEVLWDAHRSVILTSATLATGQEPSFAYSRARLGLEDPDEAIIGSPFAYERQARLILRRDMPDPSRASSAFEAALPDAVLESIERTHGGAFVLFTSNASMRKTADALREDLEALGLRVLVQGEGLERPALLDSFRQGGAVLFGVASFWQGVDVPGDALRHVIITRLPFEVPSHPLQQARTRHVEAAGGNAFRDLSLPVAALRLKQGFGRLIRHSTDSGFVTILDPRVVTKTYGRYLLGGLPECPVTVEPELDPF
jgi:ATP-dependent DNA helicase DinG